MPPPRPVTGKPRTPGTDTLSRAQAARIDLETARRAWEAAARDAWADGWSLRAIAAATGITPSAVHYHVKGER